MMKKNRFIHIEDVEEDQWNKESYAQFQQQRNLDISHDCIMEAVNQCLTEQEKNVLLTHGKEGEPFQHIAYRLNIPLKTVRNIYRRAIRKLRNFYKQQPRGG